MVAVDLPGVQRAIPRRADTGIFRRVLRYVPPLPVEALVVAVELRAARLVPPVEPQRNGLQHTDRRRRERQCCAFRLCNRRGDPALICELQLEACSSKRRHTGASIMQHRHSTEQAHQQISTRTNTAQT